MTSKQHRLRRSTAWHARRGIPIGRKVAWRVLGFASPKAYRKFCDLYIRHERSVRRARDGSLVWRESTTSREWLCAQPYHYRTVRLWEDA